MVEQVFRSHLRELVARREGREGRTWSIRAITEASGASRYTVERLLQNNSRNVPLDDLAALCTWLGCTADDILQLEPGEPSEQ